MPRHQGFDLWPDVTVHARSLQHTHKNLIHMNCNEHLDCPENAQTDLDWTYSDSIYCFRCTCLSSCFPVSWVPSALIGGSKYGFALKWGAFIVYRQLQRLVRKDTILKVYMVYPHFRTKGQTHIPTMYIPLTPKPRRIKLCRLWQLGMSTGDAINPTNTVKSQWFIMFIIMFDCSTLKNVINWW